MAQEEVGSTGSEQAPAQFTGFIEAHSQENPHGQPGAIRDGAYDVTAPESLVPMTGVECSVFDLSDSDIAEHTEKGYVIRVVNGNSVVWSVEYKRGAFGSYFGDDDTKPAEPEVAAGLLDKLQKLEAEGKLTAR